MSVMASMGTKTGKIRHEPSRTAGALGYALCGKLIPHPVMQAEPSNCERCNDERDVRAVRASHLLSSLPDPGGVHPDTVTATCSCDRWTVVASSLGAVGEHRQHMLDVARAVRGGGC